MSELPRTHGAVERFGVIGQPVGHSLSPRIFALLRRAGLFPGSYEALTVEPAGLDGVVRALRAAAWSGLSVTLPHKQAVLPLCNRLSPEARRIGAVNCLVREGEVVAGYNTDAAGFVRALRQHGVELHRARVVVLGAGGAARAAVDASLQEGCASVVIANRTLRRAQALAADFALPAVRSCRLEPSALRTLGANSTLMVNATRVGLGDPHASPLPPGYQPGGETVRMDMVYEPLRTSFLREGEALGAVTVDGRWMLVHQALEQLRLWTGYEAPGGLARDLHAALREEPS